MIPRELVCYLLYLPCNVFLKIAKLALSDEWSQVGSEKRVQGDRKCKHYSTDRKGIPGVRNQGIDTTKSHDTTSHTRDLLGKTQEGGFLCLGEKQSRTEPEAGFVCGGGGVSCGAFQGDLGLVGFCEMILGEAQGLLGFCDLILGEAQGLV